MLYFQAYTFKLTELFDIIILIYKKGVHQEISGAWDEAIIVHNLKTDTIF